MSSKYYIQCNGQETGPFGLRELVTLVREGHLVNSDQVRYAWTNEWKRADSLVGLFHMAQRSQQEVPLAPLVTVEPIHALQNEQVSIPEVDNRPGWMLRLIYIGGFRRQKPAEISLPAPELGPASVTLEASQVVVGDEPVSPAATPRVPVQEQPAEIAAYFNRDAAAQSDRWSSAVKEALASVKSRGARNSANSRTSRFRIMIGGLSRIVPRGEQGRSWMRNGLRVVCAIVCAGLVASAVGSWSAHEALRFPSRETHQAALRHFPLLGTCGSGEYLFLMCELMLVTSVAAWFAARWVESRAR